MVEKTDEWLTLSEAARILGVHPSTVRVWSNKGLLPVHRTQGGHRRFRRGEVELWAQAARQTPAIEPQDIIQTAIGRMRLQVAEGHLEAEAWYQRLDEDARERYRRSASRLFHGLMAYLGSDDEDAITEADALGYEYASHARCYGLSYVDAARAFLFFRNILVEALVKAYREANVSSSKAWEEMLHKIHAFTDRILLTLLDTYHLLEDANQ